MLRNRKVVFIMTDSQRHDMCSCYRETGLQTPCIDRLASRGMRFANAYTTQPVCQPARAAIFTGQYPHSCAGWSNSMGISDNVHTIGERLSDEGVHTAYVGKWHLDGGDYFGTGMCPKGWDERYWYDMRCYLQELSEDMRKSTRRADSMYERDYSAQDTYAYRCADRAVDFLKKYHEEDFFLTVSFDEPHDPYICPPPYVHMYDDFVFPKSKNVQDTLENKPDYQRAWAGGREKESKEDLEIKHPLFFGCNSFVDEQIGRVVDAVERYAPDAVIIYTSDHGDMLCSHSIHGKGPACYEEITHIPLIIAGKGIPQNTVNENIVSHLNLAPSIMELMGLSIPKVMDGSSMLETLEHPETAPNEHIFIEFGRYEVDHDGFGGFQPMRCAFDGRYKLCIHLLSSDELYDLKEDPDEMVNLIDSEAHAKVRNQLHDAILAEMNRTRDPFRGYYWHRRPWRTDAPEPSWAYTGMTRQREEDERYEPRQLNYADGMPMKDAVRKK